MPQDGQLAPADAGTAGAPGGWPASAGKGTSQDQAAPASGEARTAADDEADLAAGQQQPPPAEDEPAARAGLPGPEAGERETGAPGAARPDRVPWLIALAVFAAYLPISIFRYLRLDPTSWDLGIFTEYVKQYAHLRAPIVDIRGAGVDLLGDHFHPIVALIAPFFRLFPSPVTLLVAQALLTAVSVIPVSRAAAEKLGTGAGRAIGAAYGFSWGLQQMITYDFHEIAFAVPLLAFSLSALVRGRVRAAVAWALPLVLVKEDQGFTLAVIGIIIAVHYRKPAAGLFLSCWGMAWSVLEIGVFIPSLNAGHQYLYWAEGGAISPVGGHFSIAGLISQLSAAHGAKLSTLALILLPTAFIALRSPLVLAAVPGLLLRFVSTDNVYWGTIWHYNATVMPIVFIAAIDAMAQIRAASAVRPAGRLAAAAEQYGAAVMLAICATLALRFPLATLWNPQTYALDQHVQAARAAMARVPDGATVETDLDLLAPLGARTDAFWLGNSGNPATAYIVFDTASTDWQPPPANVLGCVQGLNHDHAYRLIYANDGVQVFRRAAGLGHGAGC